MVVKKRIARKAKKNKQATKETAVRPREVSAKQTILESALKIFARDGFDGASMPKIAAMSKVAHPLIHYHFGSKDQLWREMVDFAWGGLMSDVVMLDTASRGMSPLDRLRILIQSLSHFAARYPDHFAIIMAEARSNSERLAWLSEKYANVFMDRFRRILKDGQNAKQLKKAPVDQLAFILMGAVMLYFAFRPKNAKGANADALADDHAKLIWEIAQRGIVV